MTNMIDYLAWRGDLSFEQAEPNPIDFLIFAQLVHAPFERLKQGGLGQTLSQMRQSVYPAPPGRDENTLIQSRYKLWQAAEKTTRYGSVILKSFTARFDAADEKQFAAATFAIGLADVVSYRGTDSTLVGWKEDFNLSFESPIPSQLDAAIYLDAAAESAEHLYVCGHSKGGNLSIYASAMCKPETRQKLLKIYSYDGPGLDDRTAESAGYREITGRILSYVPESSIIGLLMDYHDEYFIVRSDSVSIMQHNPYYWHVLGAAFVKASEITRSSRFTDRTLHDFLSEASKQDRRVMIDTIFNLLSVTKAQTVGELPRGIRQHWPEVLAALKDVPPKNYQVLLKMLKYLTAAGSDNWHILMGDTLKSLMDGEGRKA